MHVIMSNHSLTKKYSKRVAIVNLFFFAYPNKLSLYVFYWLRASILNPFLSLIHPNRFLIKKSVSFIFFLNSSPLFSTKFIPISDFSKRRKYFSHSKFIIWNNFQYFHTSIEQNKQLPFDKNRFEFIKKLDQKNSSNFTNF